MVKAGKFAWIGGGRHLTAITHVDNVVEGLVRTAERGRGGEAYFVTDGDPVVFRDFLSDLIRTQGLEPPGRSLPAWVAGPAADGGRVRLAGPAAEGGATGHALPGLGLLPGVHHRHLESPPRAGLRAPGHAGAGAQRDAGAGAGLGASTRSMARRPRRRASRSDRS